MALTPKERENIIEEETLRYETRKNLCCQNHRCGRPRRWLWILLGILLVCFAFGRIFCGHCGYRSCAWGHGYGMMGEGKHCMMMEQGSMPGQPAAAPEKPAKK